jgi:hypothetical protein
MCLDRTCDDVVGGSSFGLADLGESFVDTWHLIGEWYGATWPNHGLPRGTPVLVELVVC